MRNLIREEQILQLLARHKKLSVTDLATELDVSEATVRRDLQAMENRGLLRRVHGGATLEGVSKIEPLFSDKEGLNTEAKQRIAEAALEHIDDDDHIYLDGGSTVLMLARLLNRKRNLTVVTNSFMAAASLMDTEHRLIVSGGEFRSISRTMVGPLTECLLGSVHVSKAFMGTIGVSLADGLTTTDAGEAFTKSLASRRARQVFLLADSSKFDIVSFANVGDIEDVDTIITEEMTDEWRQELERRNVEVVIAGSGLD